MVVISSWRMSRSPVEEQLLLDDGLFVGVQRKAVDVEIARALEVARLDFEHVVAAVTVLVDPFASRVAGEGRLDDFRRGRPSV